MNLKQTCKRILSGILGCAIALCTFPLSAFAESDEKYTYAMFAEGDNSSVQLYASNFTINGSIGTNGIFYTTAFNPNVNGQIVEYADTAMIYMNDKIVSTYFTNGNIESHDSNYTYSDTNININNPMTVGGNVELTGNIALNSSLMSAGDVVINGDVKNANNAVLYSRYGDINIECNNVNLNGLIYAPFGSVHVTTQNFNLNGIIIATEIVIDCPNINLNYNDTMARFIGVESEEMNIPYDDWHLLDDLDNDSIPDIVEKQILESPQTVDEQWFIDKFGINFNELSAQNKKGLADTLYYLYNHYETKVADFLSAKLGSTWGPLLMGNYYTGDEVSLTCIGGQLILSFFNLDLICDIRDITYDITELGEIILTDKQMSWDFAGQCFLDTAALLPVFGTIKETKNIDEVSDFVKKAPDIYKNTVNKSVTECFVDGSAIKNNDEIKGVVESNLKNVAKKANELLGDNGKFLDETLEEKYQEYLKRKSKQQNKTARDRLDWKEQSDYWKYDSPIARGNKFNETARKKYDYNEVNLISNKDPNAFTRVDSYIPGQKIISRKATDLEDIEFKTFDKYLSELSTKYKPGTVIRSNKYPELDGKVLSGQMCLEIPKSNETFSDIEIYKKHAKDKYNIEIIFLEEE